VRVCACVILSILDVVELRRDTLRMWKISVDDRKLHPTDISILRHKRLARCIHVRRLCQFLVDQYCNIRVDSVTFCDFTST